MMMKERVEEDNNGREAEGRSESEEEMIYVAHSDAQKNELQQILSFQCTPPVAMALRL